MALTWFLQYLFFITISMYNKSFPLKIAMRRQSTIVALCLTSQLTEGHNSVK